MIQSKLITSLPYKMYIYKNVLIRQSKDPPVRIQFLFECRYFKQTQCALKNILFLS